MPSVASSKMVYWVRYLISCLGNEDADALCARLKQRAIPFVLRRGYPHLSDACHGGIVVPKPANPEGLIEALQGALR